MFEIGDEVKLINIICSKYFEDGSAQLLNSLLFYNLEWNLLRIY